ncbi:MAG: DUF1993 domain-containing protein [Ignavibacteriales bacterium]
MAISMYDITVPLFIKALSNMSAILDKAALYAEEKKFDISYLLHFRLFPDQFPFVRQIQIASDNAKGAAARLAGIEPPKMEDNETAVEDLKIRIDKTIDFLKTLRPEQINGSEDKKISIWFIPGKYLTGLEYITEMVLPNFYFHITTAYSILRHNGVSIGKMDYLGPLSLKEE